MGKPGGQLSMGLHRVGHNWSDLAAARPSKSGRRKKQDIVGTEKKRDKKVSVLSCMGSFTGLCSLWLQVC